MATTSSYNSELPWFMDYGATDHLTSDLERMPINQERYQGKDQVQVANGAGLPIFHIGYGKLPGLNTSLDLKNVLHVPHIHKHLLSAYRLVSDNNVFIEIHKHAFFVKDKVTKRILLSGKSRGGLYPVPIVRTPQHASSSVRVSSSQWHQRLGHPTPTVVKSILQLNKLGYVSENKVSVCDACVLRVINYLIKIQFMLLLFLLNSSTQMFGDQLKFRVVVLNIMSVF